MDSDGKMVRDNATLLYSGRGMSERGIEIMVNNIPVKSLRAWEPVIAAS